jgi:apolipoprotein N-acyltransferase
MLLNTLSTGWRGHLLATLAGALITLSLAPFNWWPTAVISMGLFIWLLDELTPKAALKSGWFFGFGLFLSGSSWIYVSIHDYGYAPVPLAAGLTLLWSMSWAILGAVTAYGYCRWLRDKPTGRYLGFAAIIMLDEWVRSWILTGFPWLFLGYGHINSPLAGWAPIGGVFSISFIIASTGAVIFNHLKQRKLLPTQAILVAIFWLSGAALQFINWTQPTDHEPINVAMVQANIPQEIKWNRDQLWPTLRHYQKTSNTLWSENDIVIWPESAIPSYYHNVESFLNQISEQAKKHSSTLITGLPYQTKATEDQQSRTHNSIIALGNGEGIYHKQRLVPFGEYVPLEGLLRGLIQFFDLPMSAFNSGSADQHPLIAGDLTLAPFICYEIVYSNLIPSWLPEADLLITISNDAWFGNSIGPLQHLEMAQMRALESGRYLLRSTGSGVSAIVDQRGRIITRGQQFTREVIRGQALAFKGSTPFSIAGNYPIVIICLLICLVMNSRWGVITGKLRR